MHPCPENCQELIDLFLKHYDKLSYAKDRIDGKDEKYRYLGWVNPRSEPLGLDLSKNGNAEDLFMLFALAAGWSWSNFYENPVYLVLDLKRRGITNPEYWLKKENVNSEIENRVRHAQEVKSEYNLVLPVRRRVSFRKDVFYGIHELAKNWDNISENLDVASRNNDFRSFVAFMRTVKGVAANGGSLFIKIPLILRELRCQEKYLNIPGELCCVPDSRVFEAASELNLNWLKKPTRTSAGLINSSSQIYSCFKDLYDIPLFAYEDLKKIQAEESKP